MNEQFKPESAALLLIDYQVGVMQLIKTQTPENALKNAIALAKVAKIYGIPIVLTTSEEDQLQGGVPQTLRDAVPDDYDKRVKRHGLVNAWNDENFKAAVEATGRKQLIMAGVTTDICLVYPAISAVHEGYQVQAVIDASGSPFEVSEEMCRRRMQHEGVVLTATNTLLAELAYDWSTPKAQEMGPILYSIVPPIYKYQA